MPANISAPLPAVLLAAGATITVDTGDPAATVDELNVYTVAPPPAAAGGEPPKYASTFTYEQGPAA